MVEESMRLQRPVGSVTCFSDEQETVAAAGTTE